MTNLSKKERKILALAYKRGVQIDEACVVVEWRTPHHRRCIFRNLETLGLIRPTESAIFVITESGKEALGIQDNHKLMEFVK